MVVIVPPPPALSSKVLSLFHAKDDLLSNCPVLAFYGPSATATAAASSSRIQVHIFSCAGLHSYPRLTIAPSSPLYAAVNCLPREEQGDEICRGLAFSLYKYFSELPVVVRETWDNQSNSMGKLPSALKLFSEAHAAMLASRMAKVENVAEVIQDVRYSLGEQNLSWLDIDVVLPEGTMRSLDNRPRDSTLFEEEDDIAAQRYGDYASIVKLFGEEAFLPTSKLRRAPSKPTAINRSVTFSRKQKESLRREMCELLDTEENYVSKMYDLLHSVAADFRQKAKMKGSASSSPSEDALKGLFPPSLDNILAVNAEFLDAMRAILEETENDAIQDIENTSERGAPVSTEDPRHDVTGSLALAKCMTKFFPWFSDCYTDYIQAHAGFSHFLKIFMKETGSSFSRRVQETGEQRLTSMLIEPVQRLPRYNLYIDNITKQLPVRHPALKSFLKARDIITEICSRDSPTSQQFKVLDRLQNLVSAWPQHVRPQGRLISAADVVELSPPFKPPPQRSDAAAGILLLFAEQLIYLIKPPKSTMTARGLIAELDNPSLAVSSTKEQNKFDLIFGQRIEIFDSHFTERDEGRTVHIVRHSSSRNGLRNKTNGGIHVFSLVGSYEGKAVRLVEEIVKARVEARFAESEREGHKWEVRNTMGDLSLFSAIFEEYTDQPPDGRGTPAMIRVVVDKVHSPPHVAMEKEGVEVVVSLAVVGDGFYRLEVEGREDYSTRDHITAAEFLPVFCKRLSNVMQILHQIRNPTMTGILLVRNQQILSSLQIQLEGEEVANVEDRGFRPHSPVKILSNFFGGSTSSKDPISPRKLQRPLSTIEIPRMAPPPVPKSYSQLSDPYTNVHLASKGIELSTDSLSKLEETLASYVLALHARKGNVVGKVLLGRSYADELAVNELYNSLLENPSNHELAAQSPVDALFSAFEKFLKTAWKDQMGSVISQSALVSFQSNSASLYPGEFEESFKTLFGELPPQNQRALRAIVKLLADLLAGTSSDSDRGIITAAFADILVYEGNSHDFISLLDRFVEDMEMLFQRPGSSGQATPHGSVNSEARSRYGNTGSLTSNTSSLRKKFGFGTLSRENSKTESDSKVGSVWRTLSKSRGAESQPGSLSKASTLNRTKSTEDTRTSPKRPVSRERPTVLGAFSFEDSPSHSGRPFLSGLLDTIGENSPQPGAPARKKRRSSLSDLKSLPSSPPAWSPQKDVRRLNRNSPPTLSPQTPHRKQDSQRPSRVTSASPRTPSPVKPNTGDKGSQATASGFTPRSRIPSPSKENSPAPFRKTTNTPTRPSSSRSDEVTFTSFGSPSKRRTDSISGIPTLKSTTSAPSALSERATAGNSLKAPPTIVEKATSTSPQKLRMQSPQKLRERLQNEQRAIATAESNLQIELTEIGAEISNLSRHRSQTTSSPSKGAPIDNLETRLATLETKFSRLSSDLKVRTQVLSNDLASSLQVSEARVKKLDGLYRDANAENEALYSRFNEELARVLKGVRGGEGVEEMKKKLKEAEEESERLRKENRRLKRENIGLRAQLKE
ncbi:hypothetical protein M501DRAFT_1001171 [Patellaria atrata CBS 101060]|uniref:DH domain-containing protein n=1 Tax=Patellaria atrata CBS 101060 TaxID=1346257 RepID=A0A9P4S3C1_9PEZI|nr:hypothetical protein M501DRAFT_1001171 [Patellaria atrata CBS 101060]